jgi:hypothetical protein
MHYSLQNMLNVKQLSETIPYINWLCLVKGMIDVTNMDLHEIICSTFLQWIMHVRMCLYGFLTAFRFSLYLHFHFLHRFSLFFHVVISLSIFFYCIVFWFITNSVNYGLIKFYKTNHFKYYKLTRMLDILAVSVTLFWLDIVIVMNKLFTRYYSTWVVIKIFYFKNINTTSGWCYIFMPRRIIYIFAWYKFIWDTLANAFLFSTSFCLS